MTSLNSSINDTYNKFVAIQNRLDLKNKLSKRETNGLETISSFVDTMDDIDDACKKHIEDLAEEIPEGGLITGGIYSSAEASKGKEILTFQANVKNQWQNKKKTFGITASAAFGYQRERNTGNTFELTFSEIDDDENNYENNTNKHASQTQRHDESPSQSELNPGESEIDNDNSKVSRMGSITIDTRFRKDEMLFGVGANSNFYASGDQVHDQYATAVYKPMDIGANLLRRTVVSKDNVTGERIVKSQMKLELDLIDRGKNETITSETKSNNSKGDTKNTEQTSDNGKQSFTEWMKREKDGSGLDVDFEYDNSNCGFTAQYGFNLINNPEKQMRLTVAPVAGIHDHSVPTDDEVESAKIVLGFTTELKKTWQDGQSINAAISGVTNRVVQCGFRSQDMHYISFEGNYNNPRKNLSANLSAELIRSNDITMRQAQANINYANKNISVGLQAGITNVGAYESNENNIDISLRFAYTIPY